MKTKRELTEDLAHKEALWQEEMSTARQLRGELEHEKARVASAIARSQGIADQLSEIAHSRSLEIRTEALRQVPPGTPIEQRMRDAYRIEQYLAKGVTLPAETPNLTTALGIAQGVLTQMTEQLDEGYGHQIQALFEALQWAERVDRESVELAATNERIRQINAEQGDMLRGANVQIGKLSREVHDQASEIAEKTARLKSYEDPYTQVNQQTETGFTD